MIENLAGVTYDKVAVGLGQVLSLGTLTATGVAAGVAVPVRDRTYQATVTGTGAVTATVQMQGSNDGIGWVNIGTAISLSGTNTATGGFASTEIWPIVRQDVTAISASSSVSASVAI